MCLLSVCERTLWSPANLPCNHVENDPNCTLRGEWRSRAPVPQAAPLLRPAASCRCSLRAAEPNLAISGVQG